MPTLRKEELPQINDLTLHFKGLEKQAKPKLPETNNKNEKRNKSNREQKRETKLRVDFSEK